MIEREQLFVIRKPDNRMPQCCPKCGDQAQMLSIDDAASIIRLTANHQGMESRVAHFKETPNGELLICLNSLLE